MKPIKVVAWICHFSNEEIRSRLLLTKRKQYSDFSPWITNLVCEFERRDEVELHVISPHRGMKNLTYSFRLRNVSYHFFKPNLPFVHRMWPSFFPLHQWTRYLRNRCLVQRPLKKIQPAIVNLHGVENPYYSITALCIKGISE